MEGESKGRDEREVVSYIIYGSVAFCCGGLDDLRYEEWHWTWQIYTESHIQVDRHTNLLFHTFSPFE